MLFREVKILAIGVIVASLATTNLIIPAYLDSLAPVYVTTVSRPATPVADGQEPLRVLSPAEADARAAAMRAHADRALAENNELPPSPAAQASGDGIAGSLKCLAGCD